ncbi:hypothetical protein Q7P37_008033 [Cladosporium fusiforme]
MAEQCIVCLGDLRDSIATDQPADLPEQAEAQPAAAAAAIADGPVQQHHHHRAKGLRDTKLSTKRYHFQPNPSRAERALLCRNAACAGATASSSTLGRLEDIRPISLEGEVFPLSCACRGTAGGLHIDDDDEIIAHLLPCGHDLHNACLKPWVERANSCPICRAKFNSVELSQAIGAPVIDSYAVQDKVQEAEIDPSMILEDELFAVETWEPCVVCGTNNDTHNQMYCDGCDKAVHIFCAGFDVADAPDVWYCETCHVDIEADAGLPSLRATLRGQPRRPARNTTNASSGRGRRVGGRRNDTSWARVWQEVSQRLDLDLDFPFSDDEPTRDTRTPQQRREFRQWQRRFEVADRQGVSNRLRDIAQTRQAQPQPAPESQEELRAWNAFDKARELHEPNTRKRKATDSPASPREPEAEPRKLKRPRLRRPAAAAGSPPAESSHTAAQRGAEGATFLSSLLREVENNPSSAGSPGPSSAANGQYSPRNSSPARSPGSSGCGSPNAFSATPPLSPIVQPSSPPNPLFSPFSPAVASQDLERSSRTRSRARARRRDQHDSGYDENYHSGGDALSPSRNMSYSAKEEIQRMVKLALRPRYLEKLINKDQFTDINRDVSRRMYDLVGDASALTDQSSREHWQTVAADEVQKAIDRATVDTAKSG